MCVIRLNARVLREAMGETNNKHVKKSCLNNNTVPAFKKYN